MSFLCVAARSGPPVLAPVLLSLLVSVILFINQKQELFYSAPVFPTVSGSKLSPPGFLLLSTSLRFACSWPHSLSYPHGSRSPFANMPKRKLPFRTSGVGAAGGGALSSLPSAVAATIVLRSQSPGSGASSSSVPTSAPMASLRISDSTAQVVQVRDVQAKTSKRGSLALALAAASIEELFLEAQEALPRGK